MIFLSDVKIFIVFALQKIKNIAYKKDIHKLLIRECLFYTKVTYHDNENRIVLFL